MDGGQCAHGGGESGLVVAHVGAGDDGRTVGEGVEGDAVGEQPALAAGVEGGEVSGAVVGVGAAAAEGGYRDDDDVGIGGMEGRLESRPTAAALAGV